MKLIYENANFLLKIEPLFKNDGKHTVVFTLTDSISKVKTFETFLLDIRDVNMFIADLFHLLQYNVPISTIGFEDLMRTKAPKTWDILIPF